MAKKEGIYFYSDWLVPFEKLSKEELGELVLAMMKYCVNGEEPPCFQGLCGMAADFIFPQIDRSMEYARLGSKGGNASKGKDSQKKEKKEKEAEKEYESEIEFKKAPPEKEVPEDKYYEDFDDYLKEFDADMNPKTQGLSENEMFRKQQISDGFEKFWYNYPKKTGRELAKKAFERLAPDRTLIKQMLDALSKQKMSERWKKEEGRYIPYPVNWIEGRRWEDEPETGAFSSNGKNKSTDLELDEFFEAALRRAEAL